MSSYICMPSHQYIGVEWVTSGFLSKGVYCLRVHYWLVRFLNPLAQSQAGTLSKYWLISYYHLCHFCQPMKVRERWAAHSLLRQMQSIELNKLTKKNSDVLFAEKWKWKSWTISGVKKKQKTKNKTLVETVAKYRVEQTPEKNSDMLCEESVWGKCQHSNWWRIIC